MERGAPANWQTGTIVSIFKKVDQRECSNYRGISLLRFPGKDYAGVLERKCRTIVEPQIQNTHCGFRPGRGTTDQLFSLRQVFEKAWRFAKSIYTAFIDLGKGYDRAPRDLLWSILKEYGISGCPLAVLRSSYDDGKNHIRIIGSKSGSFLIHVGFRQGCVLSLLLFIIFMDRISGRSITPDCVKIGNAGVSPSSLRTTSLD